MQLHEQLFGKHTTPLFERRGLMLDVSRNRVPTMATLYTLIDALHRLRYNELQLYMEHSFAYTAHPSVWRDASPFTAAEIRTLDAYCSERGIELIPNQNSFGHMERWLQHPAYQHLAECPNGFEHPIAGWRESGGTLFPSQESLDFMRELYRELLPNFSSPKLHIGGDEPWELGQGRSAEQVAQAGKHTVYLDFLAQLLNAANELDHQPQFWADILLERPELVTHLPRNCHPVIWGYDADSPFDTHCPTVAAAGFTHNYSVAPGAGNWNSFGGRLHVARHNIARAADFGHRHQANGFLLTAWGDNGHHQPWPTLYPALLLGAQAAWGSPMADEQLPDLIDQVFQLETGTGKILCDLGAIDHTLPQPLPPVSFLHAAFFANPNQLEKLLQSTSKQALQKVEASLHQLQQQHPSSDLAVGIQMNLAAIQRLLGTPLNVAGFNQLSHDFKCEWLAVSRPGGLNDSLKRLEIYNQRI